MKSKVVLIALLAYWLIGCTKEDSTTSQRNITTQMSPVSNSASAVAEQTLPEIEPTSAVTEETRPAPIERPCASVAQSSADPNSLQRWVLGSWVNVHATPTADGAVLTQLATNTSIEMLSTEPNGEYCEISWDNDLHGFIACELLGNRPLKIDDLGSPFILVNSKSKAEIKAEIAAQLQASLNSIYRGSSSASTRPNISANTLIEKPNPNYSPTCAFWIEPTVEHLFDSGEYFRSVMLPYDQLNEEDSFLSKGGGATEPELKRFQIPEFEAMKSQMSNGVIAPKSQFTPLTAWDAQLFQRVTLSPTKPSFFKSVEDIGRPSANAETLSAQFHIPHRMAVLDTPTWGGDNNSYPLLIGAWDIGKVTTSLSKPIYEIVIGENGQIAVGTTDAKTLDLRGDSQCTPSFKEPTSQNLLPGYKTIEKSWVFFRLATPPTLTKAEVTVERQTMPDTTADGDEVTAFTLAKKHKKRKLPVETTDSTKGKTLARIDLDNDGIDDLIVWDDGGVGMDLDYHRTRLIFANVGGQWYLLDTDEEHACGC